MNKLLTLIGTHILVCAFSMSDETITVSIDYKQEYSKTRTKQYKDTEIKHTSSIQSYKQLITSKHLLGLLVVLLLCKKCKNFYFIGKINIKLYYHCVKSVRIFTFTL